MLKYLIIFVGGGMGSMLRFGFSALNTTFPWGTYLANISGTLCLGVLYYMFSSKQLPNTAYFMLGVGFCGGLTTFSSFILECFQMIQNNSFLPFFSYITASIIVGLLSVVSGYYVAKFFCP